VGGVKTDAQGDVEFLRNLVLRADVDPASEARNCLLWGLVWLVVFAVSAAFPGSLVAGGVTAVLILVVVFGPWARVRLAVAQRGPEADPGPSPALLRACNAGVGGGALLAYGLVWVLHAWSAAPVQDGGIWLLIVGSAYLVGSVLLRGLHGWLGAWLFLAGLLIPTVLPGLREASVANAVLGGGGFLVVAALARRKAR